MSATLERLDFYPPRAQGTGRALAFALAVHLALVAALTWGVSWKRQASVSTVEAEIWSALPQQAAPKAVQAAPAAATPAPEPAPTKAPDIVVEKEKPKAPAPRERQPEPKPRPQPDPKLSQAAEERKLAQQKEQERQKYLERMAGLAGASGSSNSTGSALQSGGPSSSYAGIIKARVKPNLVFAGTVSGNPMVSLEIRMAPDGTILGRPRIVKSSGSKEWDEAVLRAFEKTEVLPRDAGRIWSPLLIDWRFND